MYLLVSVILAAVVYGLVAILEKWDVIRFVRCSNAESMDQVVGVVVRFNGTLGRFCPGHDVCDVDAGQF